MKTFSLLIILISCELSVISYAQPLRIDLSVGFLSDQQSHHDTVLYSGFYTENFDGIYVYPMVALKLSYFVKPVGIQPVLLFGYNTINSVIAAGVEKPFEISYSTLAPALGIGYNWQHYTVGYRQFINNDILYWAGLSLYSPLIKGIDLMFEYRLIYKKKQTMQYETSTYPADSYFLETSGLRHFLSAGISIPLMRNKKKRTLK